MAENAERAVRYLHEATQGEEGEDGKRAFSCKWFLDRSFYCVSTSSVVLLRVSQCSISMCD